MFKESIRNTYVGYWIEKYNIKGSKSAIVECIYNLWHSGSVITNEMIFNFLIIRISTH